MDTLHDIMENYKGEVHKTNEGGDQAATSYASMPMRGGGGGRGRGMSDGGMMDGSAQHKRRRLRVDALGDDVARRKKMQVLHRLITDGSGVCMIC